MVPHLQLMWFLPASPRISAGSSANAAIPLDSSYFALFLRGRLDQFVQLSRLDKSVLRRQKGLPLFFERFQFQRLPAHFAPKDLLEEAQLSPEEETQDAKCLALGCPEQ
jgi:hypothetical protein